MEDQNNEKKQIEKHIIILNKFIDSNSFNYNKISLDVIEYMREFIDNYVSEEVEVHFLVYSSYCAIPFIKPLIKSLKDLDQQSRIQLRLLSIDNILNVVEEKIKAIRSENNTFLKTKTILSLPPNKNNSEEILSYLESMVKKFEVLNDFESVDFL